MWTATGEYIHGRVTHSERFKLRLQGQASDRSSSLQRQRHCTANRLRVSLWALARPEMFLSRGSFLLRASMKNLVAVSAYYKGSILLCGFHVDDFRECREHQAVGKNRVLGSVIERLLDLIEGFALGG